MSSARDSLQIFKDRINTTCTREFEEKVKGVWDVNPELSKWYQGELLICEGTEADADLKPVGFQSLKDFSDYIIKGLKAHKKGVSQWCAEILKENSLLLKLQRGEEIIIPNPSQQIGEMASFDPSPTKRQIVSKEVLTNLNAIMASRLPALMELFCKDNKVLIEFINSAFTNSKKFDQLIKILNKFLNEKTFSCAQFFINLIYEVEMIEKLLPKFEGNEYYEFNFYMMLMDRKQELEASNRNVQMHNMIDLPSNATELFDSSREGIMRFCDEIDEQLSRSFANSTAYLMHSFRQSPNFLPKDSDVLQCETILNEPGVDSIQDLLVDLSDAQSASRETAEEISNPPAFKKRRYNGI